MLWITSKEHFDIKLSLRGQNHILPAFYSINVSSNVSIIWGVCDILDSKLWDWLQVCGWVETLTQCRRGDGISDSDSEPGWELDRAVGSGVMTLVIMLYIITLTSCCLVSLFHSIYTHLLHFTPYFTFSNFIQILLMEKSNPETQIKISRYQLTAEQNQT